MEKLAKAKEGRPTLKTEDAVKKLEDIFKIGGTIDEACSNIGITRQTYYNWLESDNDFLTRMESAQHYADVRAKHVVVRAIDKDEDLNTAKWWLEKREFKQANAQVNIAGKDIHFELSRGEEPEKDHDESQHILPN